MSNGQKSIFEGLGDTALVADTSYFRDGTYLVRVDRGKRIKNRKQMLRLILEGTVVHAVDEARDRNDNNPMRIGEKAAKIIPIESDYFKQEVLQILVAAGLVEESSGEEERVAAAEAVFGPENILSGFVLEFYVQTIMTKAGNPFTKVVPRREVTASELIQTLSPEIRNRFWPNGALERMAEAQAGAFSEAS